MDKEQLLKMGRQKYQDSLPYPRRESNTACERCICCEGLTACVDCYCCENCEASMGLTACDGCEACVTCCCCIDCIRQYNKRYMVANIQLSEDEYDDFIGR